MGARRREKTPETEEAALTPSTTTSSPHTYWLAALARNTTGPAKSRGWPHRPAGMRSEIWRRHTGSASSFSFLCIAGAKIVSMWRRQRSSARRSSAVAHITRVVRVPVRVRVGRRRRSSL